MMPFTLGKGRPNGVGGSCDRSGRAKKRSEPRWQAQVNFGLSAALEWDGATRRPAEPALSGACARPCQAVAARDDGGG